MRVLWLSHVVPFPPQGGVLQRSYYLLKEVAKYHEITLVAFNQKAFLHDATAIAAAQEHLSSFCHSVTIIELPSDRSRLHWLWLVLKSIFTRDPYSVNWLKARAMRSALTDVYQHKQFDLIHIDTIGLAGYTDILGNERKILNHHNIESEMMKRRSYNEKNILKKTYFYMEYSKISRYEKRHCLHFQRNIVVSDLDRNILNKKLENIRSEVIPNGVDTEYFQKGECKPNNNKLVFVGRLNQYPNRNGLLYFYKWVWPQLKKAMPEVRLDIVGRNPPQDILELVHDPSITVVGYVEDVRPHLENATLYVCPLYDGGGTRLKVLDALAMGKAIVCTSIACEGLGITPDEHVLIADTPEQFVAQIQRALHEQELRERLGRAGRRLVEQEYDWKGIGKKLARLYAAVSCDTLDVAHPCRTHFRGSRGEKQAI